MEHTRYFEVYSITIESLLRTKSSAKKEAGDVICLHYTGRDLPHPTTHLSPTFTSPSLVSRVWRVMAHGYEPV
jgi:hypothetical protein